MRFGCLAAILILTGGVLRLSPGLWACLGGGESCRVGMAFCFSAGVCGGESFLAWIL
jgi:hypothetical protein